MDFPYPFFLKNLIDKNLIEATVLLIYFRVRQQCRRCIWRYVYVINKSK